MKSSWRNDFSSFISLYSFAMHEFDIDEREQKHKKKFKWKCEWNRKWAKEKMSKRNKINNAMIQIENDFFASKAKCENGENKYVEMTYGW